MANRIGNLYSAKGCRNRFSVQKLSFDYPKEADQCDIWMENCGTRPLADGIMKSNNSFMFLGS